MTSNRCKRKHFDGSWDEVADERAGELVLSFLVEPGDRELRPTAGKADLVAFVRKWFKRKEAARSNEDPWIYEEFNPSDHYPG